MSQVDMIQFVDINARSEAYVWISRQQESIGFVATLGDAAAETFYTMSNGTALHESLKRATQLAATNSQTQLSPIAVIPAANLEGTRSGSATITASPSVISVHLEIGYDDLTIACSPTIGGQIVAAIQRALLSPHDSQPTV